MCGNKTVGYRIRNQKKKSVSVAPHRGNVVMIVGGVVMWPPECPIAINSCPQAVTLDNSRQEVDWDKYQLLERALLTCDARLWAWHTQGKYLNGLFVCFFFFLFFFFQRTPISTYSDRTYTHIGLMSHSTSTEGTDIYYLALVYSHAPPSHCRANT